TGCLPPSASGPTARWIVPPQASLSTSQRFINADECSGERHGADRPPDLQDTGVHQALQVAGDGGGPRRPEYRCLEHDEGHTGATPSLDNSGSVRLAGG